MQDPELQAAARADRIAQQRAIDAARESFAAGRCNRWAYVNGHLVDLAPPARAIERPAPPVIAAPPPRALCPTCGHEIGQPAGTP